MWYVITAVLSFVIGYGVGGITVVSLIEKYVRDSEKMKDKKDFIEEAEIVD